MKIETEMVELNNGVMMPKIGFGVFQIAPEQTEQLVIKALASGYRLIDTAQLYQNEVQVGQALKTSDVKRESLFVTSKLWIDATGYDKTMTSVDRSLVTLGLEYIDLMLLHQPYGDIFGSWRALAELQQAGKIRAIGLSNFAADQVVNLVTNTAVIPQVNQIEVNPWNQNRDGIKWNEKYHIQTESFASFAEGKNDIFHNETLMKIANKYHKTVGQVILKWLDQRNVVSLIKTINPVHMTDNLEISNFELTSADMADIAMLDTDRSIFGDVRTPQTVEMLSKVKLAMNNM
ncbi:aldo/keto reductase [Lentilactobacillus kosonis]|uniref:Oxidoreductase, aldo/keto reductase family n=1 Tax=Lentilactobacillus kosonis TaxID=2810561 RepID=A0A401FNN5_9LACO|nr:aldo/keto reductase [Lentilactobacillus kosonis]GAY74005.1 oxidoreductase, aldo/keto reductase family [Lentilactobacillus kosonis]